MSELVPYLPASTAIAGLAVVVGARRFEWRAGTALSPYSDLVWLGVLLLAKTTLLYTQLDGHNEARVPWLDLTLTAAILALLLLVKQNVRIWLTFAVATAVSLWIWGDLIHYRFFQDVASSAALQARGNAAAVVASVAALAERRDLWLFLDLVPGLAMTIALTRRPPRTRPRVVGPRTAAALSVLVILALPGLVNYRQIRAAPQNPRETHIFRNRWLVAEYGLLGFHLWDLRRTLGRLLAPPTISDADRREVQQWFEETRSQRAGTGPWFGFSEGKNLVILQVESMQSFVVEERFQGVEITPNLNRRAAESALIYTAATDQSGLGRTSDSEMMAMTSLLPASDLAAAFQYGHNRFVALPGLLAKRGYTTLSAIPYLPAFWNRHVTHPAYGFAQTLTARDFEPGHRVGLGLDDRSFLTQMLKRLESTPQPFFAFLLTLTLHHPYNHFPADLDRLDPKVSDGSRLGNYLAAMRFLDTAIEELFVGLEDRDLIDDTVVVIYGDHDARLNNEPGLAAKVGASAGPPGWNLFDRVPLMIWVPGEDAPRGVVDDPVGLSDLPVTLLALLGVDPEPLAFLGRNLLGGDRSGPLVRPDDHFIDATHYFRGRSAVFDAGDCILLSRRAKVGTESCRESYESAQRQRAVSARVLEYDLQAEVSLLLHENQAGPGRSPEEQ